MEYKDGATLDSINNLVSWYQQKIAAYDKQLWEKSVEQKVLKGINKVPRKSTRVRPELIDVDLVRGSTFTKEKPQYSWLAVSTNGLLRVIFMPFFIKWWSRVTSWWFTLGLLVLYILQVAASIAFAYFLESEEQVNKDQISDLLSSVHITVPWCMMILLGMLHSHISAARPIQKSSKTSSSQKLKEKRDPSSKSYRRKATARLKGRDSGSQDVDAGVEVVLGTEGEKKTEDINMEGMELRYRVKRRSGSPGTTKNNVPRSQLNDETPKEKSRPDRLSLNLSGLTKNTVESCPNKATLPQQTNGNSVPDGSSEEGGATLHKLHSANGQEKLHDDSNQTEQAKTKARVRIIDTAGQTEGFHVVKNANGFEVDSCCSNESTDEGMLCGNSQEDPASLDGPLPQSVGTIIIPNGDKVSFIVRGGNLPSVGASELPESQYLHISDAKKNENESPSEAGSSGSGKQTQIHNKSSGSHAKVKKDNFMSSCESDVDTAPNTPVINKKPVFLKTRLARGFPPQMHGNRNAMDTECGQTSEMEWEENAMNSEVSSSDTSNCETPDSDTDAVKDDARAADLAFSHHLHNIPSVLNNLASNSDKVSCMIWEEDEVKKVDLTVLELGWTIIQNVDQVPRVCDYLYFGIFVAVLDTVMPLLFRIYHTRDILSQNLQGPNLISLENLFFTATTLFGTQGRIMLIVINSMVQRLTLSLMFFFLLSVAERTFKQRLLYAKHFCYLTSSRRARKYQLPHFRLNKVRNIKTWLSLRSYLKKRGPQRSVDMIVSAAFLTAVALVSLMSVQLLNESTGFLDHIGNWELILWCFVLAIYLLRFMTLGTKINKKYRNFSVLITEQINLYLHMELKPHKKEELMRANSVLKLAEDLLKELESPFKISGLSANPILYNVTKVVILSAFSAILTELLGFKLKLYKIKFRA